MLCFLPGAAAAACSECWWTVSAKPHRKAQPVSNTAQRRLFLFVKTEIKHFYCVSSWTSMKATDQADITGMVLIRNPFLSLTVHSQVQELDLSLNVYVPPFFFYWLAQTGITLIINDCIFQMSKWKKKKNIPGPTRWLSRSRNLPPSLMTWEIPGIHMVKGENQFQQVVLWPLYKYQDMNTPTHLHMSIHYTHNDK